MPRHPRSPPSATASPLFSLVPPSGRTVGLRTGQTIRLAGVMSASALAVASSLKTFPTQQRALCTAALSSSASTSSADDAQATSHVKPAAHIDDVDIVLYQYAICPFCNKVKAVLDYYGLRYRTIEVNPLNKSELKDTTQIETDYRKVPVATINGEVVVDSPVILKQILSLLESRGVSTKGVYDAVREDYQHKETREWIEWADRSLAVLLFPNITRNFPESWQAFSYISDVESFSAVQRGLNRVLGPVAMWAAQGKIKKKYDIEDERQALFDALYKWADAVDASTPSAAEPSGGDPHAKFYGGTTPCIADLCIFGCIRAIDGLDTHTEVVTDPRIESWYRAMQVAVGGSSNLEKGGNSY